MSFEEVIDQFRPIFKAELPDRVGRIRDGLHEQHRGFSQSGLQTAFREAHNLAGTAAYMDVPELVKAAETLASLTRGVVADGRAASREEMMAAWEAYDRVRIAARAYFGDDAAADAFLPAPVAGAPDDIEG